MFKLLLPLILAVSAIAQNNVSLVLERPGGLNGIVATPTASPAAGAVANPTTVTFSTSTSGATIRYTSGDGTQAAPTSSTGTAGSSVSVTTATTYKVAAYKAGMADSAVATFAYTIAAVGGSIGLSDATGTSGTDYNQSVELAYKFTASANGSNGTFNLYCNGYAGGTQDVAVGVYSDSGGNANSLLASTSVTCPSSAAWVSASLTGMTWVNGTSYWLAIQPKAGNGASIYRKAGSAGQEQYATPGSWGGSLPSTFTWAGSENLTAAIYVAY